MSRVHKQKVLKWIGALLGGYIVFKVYKCTREPPWPVINPDPWWGPGERQDEDPAIKKFQIKIPQTDIEDLKTRLTLPSRLTESLEGSNFTYGFSSKTLEKVIDYWKNKYDWKTREEKLNEFDHYKTQIEGLDIHFMRIKPKVGESSGKVTVRPLLLVHGWPGSFVEFYDLIPKLTTPQEGSDVVFEVICPSVPGFGFSAASAKQGLGVMQTAQIFLKLMKKLGFNQFYVQGGDFGSRVASTLGTFYPDNILGIHHNVIMINHPIANLKYFIGMFLPSGFVVPRENEHYLYPFGEVCKYLLRESGYFHIQATKPDTVGVALNSSPVGLAAYILEKFSTWTNRNNVNKVDGGINENFPIPADRLLDNLSVYWFTKTITSSMRFYAENVQFLSGQRFDEIPCKVPAGFAAFPHEIINDPPNFIKHKFMDIVSYNYYPEGGHFAAMECPDSLAKDIHQFVTLVEKRKKKEEEDKKSEL